VELNPWAETDIPRAGWCNRKASRASVRDLRGLREVVVAVGLALVMGRGDRCIEGERWVWCIQRSNGG